MSKHNQKTTKTSQKQSVKNHSNNKSSINANWLWIGIPVVLTLIVYWGSLWNDFIPNWDDGGYILKYPPIQQLTWENLKIIFSDFYKGNYHPLTTLFYAIEYHFVGASPFLYHLNNLIIHSINVVLVFYLCKRLTSNIQIASFCAIIMGIHPMHVESVAWISERKDVMYTFFFMLSAIYYLKYRMKKENQKRNYIISVILFPFSLLSKSAGVPLPVLLLLFDYYQGRKFDKYCIIDKIPFFVFSVAFGLIAILSQKSAGAIQDLTPIYHLYERPLLAGYAMMLYLIKFFAPFNLSAMYPYPDRFQGLLPTSYYIMPFIGAIIVLLVFLSLKKSKHYFFGFAFFIITIILVLQLLPVGGAIAAERYTYVPYIGISLMLGFGLEKLLNFFKETAQSMIKVAYFVVIAFVLYLSFLTYERIKLWENGEVLFTDVIKKYPSLPFAYNNRGYLYYAFLKNNEKALKDYTTAIKMDTTNSNAYSNRGVLYYNTGRYDEAISDFNNAIKYKAKNTDALIGRANTLSTLKRYSEAIPDYNTYLGYMPNDTNAYMWRGIAYFNINKLEEAKTDLQKTITMNPRKGEAYYWLGVIYHQEKQSEKAIEYFINAEKNNYTIAALYSWRGLAYYAVKKYNEAIADYTKALELNPNDAAAWVNRSVAHLEIQNYQAAFNDIDKAGKLGYPLDKAYFLKVAKLAGVKVNV